MSCHAHTSKHAALAGITQALLYAYLNPISWYCSHSQPRRIHGMLHVLIQRCVVVASSLSCLTTKASLRRLAYIDARFNSSKFSTYTPAQAFQNQTEKDRRVDEFMCQSIGDRQWSNRVAHIMAAHLSTDTTMDECKPDVMASKPLLHGETNLSHNTHGRRNI